MLCADEKELLYSILSLFNIITKKAHRKDKNYYSVNFAAAIQ
jgi:hypothetical protein